MKKHDKVLIEAEIEFPGDSCHHVLMPGESKHGYRSFIIPHRYITPAPLYSSGDEVESGTVKAARYVGPDPWDENKSIIACDDCQFSVANQHIRRRIPSTVTVKLPKELVSEAKRLADKYNGEQTSIMQIMRAITEGTKDESK